MSANSVTVTKGASEDFQMSYGVFNVSIGHEEVIIKVPETLILQVNTATSSYRTTEIKDITHTLNFKNANSVPSNDYFALWHFSGLQTVTNLGIEIIGPATVSFFVSNTSPHLVEQLSGTVNLFGVIRSINNSIFSEVKQVPAKRKIDDVLMKKEKEVKEEQVSAPVLNKESRLKARRKMAKQKQKELTEALNKINGKGDQQSESHPEKENEKEFVPTNTSPMSERRLADGIIVKDIIIGGGAMVKSGRKCSILYTGKLHDGKIFDKKLNRNSPLEFRLGTGQVIKGLERGLEGMRSGGERIIEIPPKMGYGKKGSKPQIPGNATLFFSVHLLSIGGAR